MFETNNPVTARRHFTALRWLALMIFVLAIYLVVATDHRIWPLACTTIGSLLIVIDARQHRTSESDRKALVR
jgi:hypothetical protein